MGRSLLDAILRSSGFTRTEQELPLDMSLFVSRSARHFLNAVAVLGLTASAFAADETAPATQTQTPEAKETQELKQQLADQQKQIEELRMILLGQKKEIDTVKATADATTTPAEPVPAPKSVPGDVASLAPIVPPLPAAPAPKPAFPANPAPAPAPQKESDQPPTFNGLSPLSFKIGDTLITPVGFMDLTNTWRSTNAGTSLQTNFGSIPYNNGTTGRMTEDKLSAANSRIGFRADGKIKDWDFLGYFEGDFVGGIGNTAYNTQVSSNSLIFRIRQYYVTTRHGKFEFQAGQSWSMMTPNRVGISPLPGDLFYGQAVDVNYLNGLTWGRIPGVRFVLHPSEKVTWGLSLENSAQYFGGSGGGGLPVLPAALATSMAGELDQNVSNGVATPNVAPDVISKLAFDPSNKMHFEIDGVVSEVKLFNPSTQKYFLKEGAGGSFNANFQLAPGFRIVTNNFWSDGEGRYLFGVIPDFIVRADGSPSMIHAGSTLDGFEYTHKNINIYAYYGGVTGERNTALDANGTTLIGYGYKGSANSQNRTTQELTFGLNHTLWRDAKYGALQMFYQYAYFMRDPWYVNVAGGAPKNTHEDAIFFNMRYLLPGQAPSVHY
jgi:hypothetical protein